MKRFKFLFVFCLSLGIGPQLAVANQGTANAVIAVAGNLGAAGASGQYSGQQFAQCKPPKGISHCIQGVLGIVQAIQSLLGAANSASSGSDLAAGDFGNFQFDPAENGFCFDPSTGCTPDGIDNSLASLDGAFKTGSGLEDALRRLADENQERLSEFEDQGFQVDQAAGTITDLSLIHI